MSTTRAEDYRKKADEFTRVAGKTRSLREGSGYRKMAQAYRALAETEEWLDGRAVPAGSPQWG